MQYKLFLNPRARHVRIRVSPETGLRVTIPKSFPVSQVDAILEKRRDWIFARMREIQKIPRLSHGFSLRFLDEFLTVRIEIDEKAVGKEHVVKFGDELYFFMSEFSLLKAKKMLRAWLAIEAKKYFSEKLSLWSQRTAIPFRSFSVRGQKTRWGSASRRRTLSLNYKLLLMPGFISDYLVVHELCHLVCMNHSGKFWKLMGQHFPRFAEARKWLRKEGRYLVI